MTITRRTPHALLPALLALLTGGAFLATGASAAPAHRPIQESIKATVLTTSDVTQVYGGGFRAFINGEITNKELAAIEKSSKSSAALTMARAGRVTGYDSTWIRGSRTGSLSVTNVVNQYRNSSFPQAAFRLFSGHAKPTRGYTIHYTQLGGVGDQALVATISTHGVAGLAIVFRRGNYLADVIVSAQHGATSLASVTRLATIEDQRIQAHG